MTVIQVGADRYAVAKRSSGQVLGFAVQNDDDTWSIELHDGKIVEVRFDSLRCAADALRALGDNPY